MPPRLSDTRCPPTITMLPSTFGVGGVPPRNRKLTRVPATSAAPAAGAPAVGTVVAVAPSAEAAGVAAMLSNWTEPSTCVAVVGAAAAVMPARSEARRSYPRSPGRSPSTSGVRRELSLLDCFGIGINVEEKLKVDATLAEDILYTFGNLLSGPSHHVISRISATYSF